MPRFIQFSNRATEPDSTGKCSSSMIGKGKRCTVMIVENESLVRVHAACTLERERYMVIEATNAENALRLLELRLDVNVLFTDIQVPGRMNGLALAREVHRRWPEIKLLVTSGRQKPHDDEFPYAVQFLPKPYLPHELLGAISNLVKPSALS